MTNVSDGYPTPGHGPASPVPPPPGPPAAPAYPMQQGYPPQPGFPMQGAYAVVVKQSTNGLAIASMVLGILWIYWIGSILALVFGYVAKGQIARSGGQQGGRGMAIAGIVLGWIGIGILLLGVVVAIAAAGSTP
jgi:Domain of unknown function (DUF4190)